MVVKKTNLEIYNLFNKLNETFLQETKAFPVKIYFKIQKNINLLKEIVDEIDKSRMYIVNNYGILREDGQYEIPENQFDLVNNELDELGNIEQEINISILKFEDIENLELTPAQMEAIMFMIEEE